MHNIEFQHRLKEISQNLSEKKLAEVIDFAAYLLEKEDTEDLIRTQMSSMAYQGWISSENDIYDEVFADETEQRNSRAVPGSHAFGQVQNVEIATGPDRLQKSEQCEA